MPPEFISMSYVILQLPHDVFTGRRNTCAGLHHGIGESYDRSVEGEPAVCESKTPNVPWQTAHYCLPVRRTLKVHGHDILPEPLIEEVCMPNMIKAPSTDDPTVSQG